MKLRSSALITLIVWAACPCFGQVVLAPKNADGLYNAGEKVVWTVKPASDSKTINATYTIHKNGTKQVLQQGTLDLSSGNATIESVLDESGELVLEVMPQNQSATNSAASSTNAPETGASERGGRGFGGFGGGRARDGAIVDAENLKPSLPRPDDFDAWWSKKLEELEAIPANPKLDKVDVNVDGIEYYKITLDNINDTHVQGQLAKPAKEGKFPAILQLQYAGVYPLQRQWVTDRAKAGWLALNVQAHDMPIDDQVEIQRLSRGPLNNYQNIGNANREQSYFLRMYLGDCRALEYLASRPDWDGKTLVVMGDSMGGQQSFAAVGLIGEKLKVTAMICHVPSGADVGARSTGRSIAYPNWPNRPEVIETARYFDIANFAPKIKAASLVSVGLFDGTSPPTGVISAFNLIAGPKELLPLHSDHGGPNQQPRIVRREEWLSALVKGEPVTPRNNFLHQSSIKNITMKHISFSLSFLNLLALTVGIVATTPSNSSAASPDTTANWTADNGNGTYSNPLFYEEFEDPDVIRVGEDYYLAGTTMHMNPAVQLMHSKDLVNWELVGYCMDRLDLGPAFRQEGGRGIYGQGIWAPCLRYHEGMFYVFSNVNGAGLQVFRSKSIKGPWERNQLPGRHDLSVLFDDDDKIYIISGARSPYPIEELTPDVKSFVPGVRHQLDGRMGEGHHLYKIKGKYYDISAIPGGTVDQMVARADFIDGPWTVERMVQGESLGVPTVAPARVAPGDRGLTLHQGSMVDTPSGEWWSIIMSDHGSAGRMVALVPITWDNDFPLIGLPGNLRKAPNTWIKPNTGYTQDPKPSFIHDDNFDGGKLNPLWQWNHVPDDTKWSITEKPGVLRLHSLPARDFYAARNSICQRPPGPESIMTVELDTSSMVAGDTAGLALLSSPYAWIGVVKSAEGTTLQMLDNTGGGGRRGAPATPPAQPTIGPANPPNHLWLRVHCNFDTDQAVFSWSADGKEFTPLGNPFTMTFQLTTFQGVRPSLFHYNTSGQPGGYVDFDNYTVGEPRARGIEREIPMGKTIVLTSGADGSFLAADTQNNALVNVAADAAGTVPQNAKFQVVDLGLGRVALKAANGRFVSASGDGVSLKGLAGKTPGDAESFQWINLMRGDTMLMSLKNHRYLATKPNSPGPVTVSATGPRPDRKDGACFKWKEVE